MIMIASLTHHRQRRRRQPNIMDMNFMGYSILAMTTLMTTMMMMTASGTFSKK